jgi:DNA polymerase-3 subunit epsilon
MLRQIILDTETTGLDPTKGHRLTEIGCLEMVNRRLTGKKFHTYLNPEREVEPGAFEITGLSTEFLQDKPKFVEVAEDFIAFLKGENTELIIHNAPFDLGFLNCELALIKHPFGKVEEKLKIIDTLLMARKLHPGQKNNLDALCRRYNVDNTSRKYHGALLDAEILVEVYLKMTAGQDSLILTPEETLPEESLPSNIKLSKPLARPGLSLVVIRANEEELLLHEKRMAELQGNKA